MIKCNFVILNTPLGSDIPLSGLAVLLSGSEWVTDCVLWSGPLVYSCFSAHQTSHKHNTFLTSRGDLRASLEYSFCVSRSLLSCRSKGQADRKLQEQTTTAAQLYSKSPERHHGETQGQQCAHGPCSHPLWKHCLSPVPRNISERKRSQLYEGWQSIVCGRDSCEAARTVW